MESEVEMTRFGVMKHLRVLEDAGLVVTRRSGREKLHFLNPVPIRLIHDRWIDKYTERQVTALTDLKRQLEEEA
jgi:DNA-binding transcriptional ArsR family regulator